MSTPLTTAPGADTFNAFGAIVTGFARCEYLMAILVSGLTNTDIMRTLALMADLSYGGKRNATRSVIDLSPIDDAQKQKLKRFLGEIHKHNGLRNCIAHNIWDKGKRPGSIKPFGVSVRSGTMEVRGMDDDDPDFLKSDLEAVVSDLFQTYNTFRDYLVSVGLMPDIEE